MDEAALIAYANPGEHGNIRRMCVESASAESGSLDISRLATNVSALSRPADPLIVRFAPASRGNDDRRADSLSEHLQAVYEGWRNRVESAAATARELCTGEVSGHEDEPDFDDLLWEGLTVVARSLAVAVLIAIAMQLALF